jgi:hypothetical protein
MRPDRLYHRQKWTPEQIAELMRLTRLNLTAHEIAMQLGRTEEAVQLKARLLGLVISKAVPSIRQ